MTTNETDFLHFLKTRDMDFEFAGKMDMPVLQPVEIDDLSKVDLLGFNYATNPQNMIDKEDRFIHFFLADGCFAKIWDNLEYYEGILNQYRGIIMPNFSMYTTMPRAMQIWNCYRNMWLASYYQQHGITVIPSIQWSDEESFEYTFDGMPRHSCLCVSSVGCVQNPQVRQLFNQGFRRALKELEPTQLIVYGKLTDDMRSRIKVPYINIESEMKQRIDKWKNK